jgi:protein-disulfide isomerase
MIRLLAAGALALAFVFGQIGYPVENFRQGLKLSDTSTKISYNKSVLQLQVLAGLLYKVDYRGPTSDPASAAQVMAVSIGQPGSVEQLVSSLKQNLPQLKGRGRVRIKVAEGFDLRLEVVDELRFSVGPEEVQGFGPDRYLLGKKGVVIREFSDFECPFCKKLALEVLTGIRERLVDTGKARLSYRHLPLFEIHPNALPAAMASECAGLQNRFWEYHDGLFDRGLTYLERAQESGLNMQRFQSCMASAQTLQAVYADYTLARKLGLTATPTVFVGPFKLPNPTDPSAYERYIRMAEALGMDK